MQFSPPAAPIVSCAGVAQWEERGPRQVRDRRSNRHASSAGIAQREEQVHGKRPAAVRGCVPAPEFAGLSAVEVQRACYYLRRELFDSLDQLPCVISGVRANGFPGRWIACG